MTTIAATRSLQSFASSLEHLGEVRALSSKLRSKPYALAILEIYFYLVRDIPDWESLIDRMSDPDLVSALEAASDREVEAIANRLGRVEKHLSVIRELLPLDSRFTSLLFATKAKKLQSLRERVTEYIQILERPSIARILLSKSEQAKLLAELREPVVSNPALERFLRER